jgi:hypothetical protein
VGKRLDGVQTEAHAGVLEAVSHHQSQARHMRLAWSCIMLQKVGYDAVDWRCDVMEMTSSVALGIF